jgi:hypothetical protein
MFRVSFFCDDRKLAGALRVLVGVAVGAPEVAPIDETSAEPSPRRDQHNGGPALVPQLADWLLHDGNNVTELRIADIRAWLASIGRSPSNAAHVAKLATKRGLLTRHGEGRASTYTVVTKPPDLPIAKVSKRGVRVMKPRRKS